jgi:hypothetical protein
MWPHSQRHRLYISNYDAYWPDCEDGHKGRTAVAVKKGIFHTCIDLLPLLSIEATGVYIPIGNTEVFLAAIINLCKDCGVTPTSQSC